VFFLLYAYSQYKNALWLSYQSELLSEESNIFLADNTNQINNPEEYAKYKIADSANNVTSLNSSNNSANNACRWDNC
jgi:alkaline phosphatase